MDYDALLKELYGLERFGIKLGLDTITELLAHMGNPHRRFKTVHVTGKNDKCFMCALVPILHRRAGIRIGLYSSPNLLPITNLSTDGVLELTNRDVDGMQRNT